MDSSRIIRSGFNSEAFFDGVQAVYGFTTNMKIRFAVEIGADELPDFRTVINNENILWHV